MNPGRKIDVMGIINITDNSYYAESRCLDSSGNDDLGRIVSRAAKMIGDGATILDIGACSTRPGSDPVGEDEECRRLEPALKAIRQKFPEIAISVDTYWPSVVRRTFDTIGPFIVNDVTAGEGMYNKSDEMLRTVAELGLPFVAMHMRGNPKTMQSLTEYDNVTAEVLDYFRQFASKAEAAGVKDWILDPGFGFAKTIEQNYQMLRELDHFAELGKRILVGMSRKSMIFRKFGITPEESLPATQVLHYKALCLGADILRVHDVAEAVRTVALYRELEH
ncbi:MAG: dihydropteroate synthase [Candidatus Cryptobacteroides sp.]|nr:dihydropteroate synthase [Candidatus Cryptobacteroides sp.]